MIHLFNSRGRILFFPVKWANAVASWILGLHSPSGTIRIKNTSNPTESGGASVDVDMEVVTAKTKERLTGHFQTKREVEASIERAADGSSIVARDRRLHVSEDWLKDKIGEVGVTLDTDGGLEKGTDGLKLKKQTTVCSTYGTFIETVTAPNALTVRYRVHLPKFDSNGLFLGFYTGDASGTYFDIDAFPPGDS